MTWFELYAFFGSPLLVLLIALALCWITGRMDRAATPAAGSANSSSEHRH